MRALLAAFTAEEILGICTGVAAGLVTVITAIGKIINEQRRKNGNCKCCITGRPLKPKKKKENGSPKS